MTLAVITTGTAGFNMDLFHIGGFNPLTVAAAASTATNLTAPGVRLDISGFVLTYDGLQHLSGGTVTRIDLTVTAPATGEVMFRFLATGVNILAQDVWGAVASDNSAALFSKIFNDADVISSGATADLIRGYDGDDTISSIGNDTLFGGVGNDRIQATATPDASSTMTYLRGEEGADTIIGADGGPAQFDDINGNQGDDLLFGAGGADWVVGGKDNDRQFGDDGDDIVWGNLGNDTLDGGAGNDQVRGGQGDDIVLGGAGNDFVSGDRGDDTITGGAGADVFHGSQDAGIDRVLDFSLSDGDRVMLDPGTTYTVSQIGADTVLDMGAIGGVANRMILVGVSMSTLTASSIFLG